MLEKVQHFRPDAVITGVTIERMIDNPNNRELMIGIFKDPIFDHVISFIMGPLS